MFLYYMALGFLLSDDDGWTCTICHEAKHGYSECCSIRVTKHVHEIMIWLTRLLVSINDGAIADDNLEVCDQAMVFRLLLSPQG